MREHPLTNRKGEVVGNCKVSDNFPQDLFDKRWSVGSHGYARVCVRSDDGKFKTLLVHRIAVGAKAGEVVDHINLDKLDCTQDNLRVGTHQTNAYNRPPAPSRVPYKGVHKSRTGYYARIKVAKRIINIGVFSTAELAAEAYDRASRQHHGDLGRRNFPERTSND